jgi:hypothetical protein
MTYPNPPFPAKMQCALHGALQLRGIGQAPRWLSPSCFSLVPPTGVRPANQYTTRQSRHFYKACFTLSYKFEAIIKLIIGYKS